MGHACGAPQPFDLTSNQWEKTGKLPPNAEKLLIPRANLNPIFEVEGDAHVPIWAGKAWPCTVVGSWCAAGLCKVVSPGLTVPGGLKVGSEGWWKGVTCCAQLWHK